MTRYAAYQEKNVLLVGGLGLIGANLAILLVQQGARVTIVDNFLPDHGANLFNIEPVREQVHFQSADMRDPVAMQAAVQNQDLVFNIAAQTSHSDSMHNPLLDLDINCKGNLILLEACRQHNPTARMVFVGTRAFYGTPQTLPVNEQAALQPQDIYAVNRLAAEQYHFVYQRHYGLSVTSLRLGNLFGPRSQMKHPRYNVLNYFIRMALDDQCIQIYGDGQQQRDYLFIDDACHALALAGIVPAAVGQVLNIASGQSVAFKTLIDTLVQLCGRGRWQHAPWPAQAQAYDVGDFCTDISAAARCLDWRPTTSWQDGLAQTVAFYQQHRQHYW
ncbi:MAG: GDP-mannose 4,6-dehydratase [Candidatus Sericytochromatia bacterium]|nr:GDP-mannose 4,6-dehydratase [Candidatus Sericytochromatia bacterium]